jgi:hypothetical protein
MSILANVIEPGAQSRRNQTFWVILGVLAAGQLFAFWLLCSHQVRKAEARHNEAVVHQMAQAECLQFIPGSTIASCTAGGAVARATAQPATKAAVSAAVPVSFSYR